MKQELCEVSSSFIQLTRKNIRGCITFLDSFIRVPSFRNTCTRGHLKISHVVFAILTFSGCVTYSAGLDDLMVAVETVLDLHQLLEVVLKTNMRDEESHETEGRHCESSCFKQSWSLPPVS